MEEVLDIKSMYFARGRSLRLRNDDIGAICKDYPNESGHEQALNDILLLWLKKRVQCREIRSTHMADAGGSRQQKKWWK